MIPVFITVIWLSQNVGDYSTFKIPIVALKDIQQLWELIRGHLVMKTGITTAVGLKFLTLLPCHKFFFFDFF